MRRDRKKKCGAPVTALCSTSTFGIAVRPTLTTTPPNGSCSSCRSWLDPSTDAILVSYLGERTFIRRYGPIMKVVVVVALSPTFPYPLAQFLRSSIQTTQTVEYVGPHVQGSVRSDGVDAETVLGTPVLVAVEAAGTELGIRSHHVRLYALLKRPAGVWRAERTARPQVTSAPFSRLLAGTRPGRGTGRTEGIVGNIHKGNCP